MSWSFSFDAPFLTYVRTYSKLFKKVCNIAKAKFISENLKNLANKVKTIRNVINHETGRSVIRQNQIDIIDSNKLIDKAADVARVFSTFSTNIPMSTTRCLDSSQTAAEYLLRTSVSECSFIFKFELVSPQDVVTIFKSLGQKSTADFWGISVKLISYIIDTVAPYLATTFNRCIDSGVFPDFMKYSKVITLFKSGDKSDTGNYRPISIVPAFSKIFEKLILKQLLRHFNLNSLLHSGQYVFTKGRSTTDAGVPLKHIYNAWEKSQNAIGVFCDLSKAFDCVHHDTLLNKLRHYGEQNSALGVINSYLHHRVHIGTSALILMARNLLDYLFN